MAPGAAREVSSVSTPTTGFDVAHVPVRGGDLTLREVGSAMTAMWHRYYAAASAVVYVVDASDPAAAVPALVELATLLDHADMRGKQTLVFLNKCDAVAEADVNDLEQAMELAALPVRVLRGSALRGDAAAALFAWATEEVARDALPTAPAGFWEVLRSRVDGSVEVAVGVR